MIIFRKELRSGAAGFLVWAAVIGGLMAVCVGLYPSISGSMGDMSALFAGMGDFSAAFGMDKLQFGSVMGFYGVECGNILGLGGAFYAALTAMGLLAGEEGGHTAEFLLTHPVSRLRVAGEKLAALAVLIAGLNLICLACGAGGVLAIGEEAEWADLLRYHGAVLLMQLEVGGLCFGLSAFLRRGGLGLAMGLAALLYFAGLLVNLDQGLDWLRFVTPYYYADAARVFAGGGAGGPHPGRVRPGGAGGRVRPVVVPEEGRRVAGRALAAGGPRNSAPTVRRGRLSCCHHVRDAAPAAGDFLRGGRRFRRLPARLQICTPPSSAAAYSHFRSWVTAGTARRPRHWPSSPCSRDIRHKNRPCSGQVNAA